MVVYGNEAVDAYEKSYFYVVPTERPFVLLVIDRGLHLVVTFVCLVSIMEIFSGTERLHFTD